MARGTKLFGWILISPTLAVLLFLAIFPFAYLIYLSFQRFDPFISSNITFVGFQNYVTLTKDISFPIILENTFVFLAAVVLLVFAFGLVLALMLRNPFPGRNIIIILIMIPFMLSTAVIGTLWRISLQPFGYVNYVVTFFHIKPEAWLDRTFGSPTYVMIWLIIAAVWELTPLIFLILFTGFNSIPKELYEAAQVDGMSSFRQFRIITFPLSRTTIFLALFFAFLFPLRSFGLVYNLTYGGPGIYTATLPFYIYLTGVSFTSPYAGYGYASVLSILLLVIVSVIVIVLNLITRGQEVSGFYER